MYSEAHIQRVISYHHEVLGQKVTKKQAREMIMLPDTDITREQYMQFPADWCKSHTDCWAQIVDSWQRPEAYVERRRRWENRLAATRGASHH